MTDKPAVENNETGNLNSTLSNPTTANLKLRENEASNLTNRNGVSTNDIAALSSLGFKEIIQVVEQLDQSLYSINNQFIATVFNRIEKVYASFTAIATNKQLSSSAIYDELEAVLETVKEKKVKYTAEGLAVGINDQLLQLKAEIDQLPYKIVRTYKPEDLLIKESDSLALRKQKKKLTRWTSNPKTKVRVQAIAQHQYETKYLVHFKELLNSVGLVTFQLNGLLKKWLKEWSTITNAEEQQLALLNLKQILDNQFNTVKERTHKELNRLGRKYCNSILSDSNQLTIDEIVLLREEERTLSDLKIIYASISDYPLTFKNNSDLLINQLEVSISLLRLKQALVPKINSLLTDVKEREITPVIAIANQVLIDADSLKVDGLISLENELLELGIEFNPNHFIADLTTSFKQQIKNFCKDVIVIPEKSLAEFDFHQENILPDQINVKRVTEYLLENEILTKISNLLRATANKVKAESLKMENGIRLLQFTITNQKEEEETFKKVKNQVETELSESSKQLETASKFLEVGLKNIVLRLDELLTDDFILGKAEHLNGIIRKEKARNGYSKLIKPIGNRIENVNNNIDKLIIKGKDLLAISSHQYRTKELQNPHSKINSFVASVSISNELNQKLPFYYHQLFIGKQSAPAVELSNRAKEIALFNQAYKNFSAGKTGAILFTGEQQSGMSYLIQNIIKSHDFERVIRLEKPSLAFKDANRLVERAFKIATGMNLSIPEILAKLPHGTVFLIEDVELWWTRSEKGMEVLDLLNKVLREYNHKVLFIISCNSYFYQLIRQVINLDANLLETIMLLPLKIQDIKKAIIARHKSGGLQYVWKGKHENEISNRKENQLIKRIASVSEGNIGASFYTWLGNIDSIKNNKILFTTINQAELPNVLSAELENVLLQLLLHKELSIDRLDMVYKFLSKEQLVFHVDSLKRMGLIEEIGEQNYRLNPYAMIHVVKYLRKKDLIN